MQKGFATINKGIHYLIGLFNTLGLNIDEIYVHERIYICNTVQIQKWLVINIPAYELAFNSARPSAARVPTTVIQIWYNQ